MTPMQIWSNESQERYVLAIAGDRIDEFERLCERERCPFAVVGDRARRRPARGRGLALRQQARGHAARGAARQAAAHAPRREAPGAGSCAPFDTSAIDLREAAYRVLRLPAVADKTFLVTIGDRTVGGMCARDQMVGPWQVPVADCAVTTMGYATSSARPWPSASARRSRSSTARPRGAWRWARRSRTSPRRPSRRIGDIKLSANWMCAAGHPGEDASLFDTVKAVGMELCPALGVAIPVGKDSMSMKTTWTDAATGEAKSVTAPLSLIVSAFAPVDRCAADAHAAAAHGRWARRSSSSSTSAAGRTASAARRSRRCTASSATRRPTSTIPRSSRLSSARSSR